MLSDALKTDISSSRSLTYRRNVLAIGSVLALLYWYPKINLNELSFFGVKPPSGSDNHALVFGAVWVILLYHFAFFVYYAWRDWRRWLKIALKTSPDQQKTKGFPELQMYFGSGPRSVDHRAQSDGTVPADWIIQITDNKRDVLWMPAQISAESRRLGRFHGYQVSKSDIGRLREDVCWFFANDVGLPTLAIAFCTLLAAIY